MPRTLNLPAPDQSLAALVRWVVAHNDQVVICEQGRRLAVLLDMRAARAREQTPTQQMKRNLLKRLAQIRRRQRRTSGDNSPHTPA